MPARPKQDQGEMGSGFKRNAARIFACLGILAVAGIIGFAGRFQGQQETAASEVFTVSASETVEVRFPPDWTQTASSPTLAFASADASLTLFNPTPTYPLGAGQNVPPAQTASVPPVQATAELTKPATPRSAARPNAVLNDSQIASIKRRLNLTRDQERYWPAVEAELRKMEYKKDPKAAPGTRTAAIDVSKVNVEGLKSAGFPLVMSFNDDQRRELKSLAHLFGLEGVMSGF
jgi:hypothetical protein